MTLEEFNNTQGRCPKCWSDAIEEERHDDPEAGLKDVILLRPYYDVYGRNVEDFYVNCICTECGCVFRQRYHLRYAGQQEITR